MLPKLPLGHLEVSRLIIGGNPIVGWAHPGTMEYVNGLFKTYYTADRALDALRLSAQHGINTWLARTDDYIFSLLDRYRSSGHPPLHWIAQTAPERTPLDRNIREAIAHGAAACFIHGGTADRAFADKKLPELRRAIELIKEHGLVAGLGCHNPRTLLQAVELQFPLDFCFMTLNPVRYHCAEPDLARQVIGTIPKPFVCFKVLGAGRCSPRVGFKFALAAGAHFLAVGMFDYQVAQNVEIVNQVLAEIEAGKRTAYPQYTTSYTSSGTACRAGFQLTLGKPNSDILVEKIEVAPGSDCPALRAVAATLRDRFLAGLDLERLKSTPCPRGDCLAQLVLAIQKGTAELQNAG